MKAKTAEKRCWNPKCKRTIVGNSKLGLCSTCLDKYGSPVIALGATGMCGAIWKNKEKIFNGTINVIKRIKP